jgi:hypothetical protein
VSNWPTAVFNAMDIFSDEFRCITMDQRNANGGESSGPIPVDDPQTNHEYRARLPTSVLIAIRTSRTNPRDGISLF